jgi:hypothetical protein
MKSSFTVLLLPILLLAACNPRETPIDNTVATIKNLTGAVVEGEFVTENNKSILKTKKWTGGEGEVLFNIARIGRSPLEASRTALDVNGNWSFSSLPIPKLDSTDKIMGNNEICPNKFVISDPEVLSASGLISVASNKNGFIEMINNDGVNVKMGGLIYVDRAVNLKGKQSCKTANGIDTGDFNLNLAAGWNMITSTRRDGDNTFTVRNGSPVGAQWVYFQGFFIY